MHDPTKYAEKIAAKQSPLLNLENGSPALGSESAPVTIVEFGDYQCEACYHWFHNTRDTLIDNYIETGKAKLVFVDLPFLGRDSPKAAQASYCAEDQGKYWEYHTMLYTFQDGQPDSGWADRDRLNSFAFSLDMNMDEFNDCMDSSKYAKRVKANYDEAVKNGVQQTPTFIIISQDGTTEKFAGAQPYSVFAATIEPML
jgi:protein-disulfide isomerase